MIHRVLIAAVSAGLVAGFFAGEAEAGKYFRSHWFFGYGGYYPEPEYMPPPRYSRYYDSPEDMSPEEYDEIYGGDFDESYYDPSYDPPVRKTTPVRKKSAVSQPTARKNAAPLETASQLPANSSKPKASAALSCDKAGSIVGGYGFSAIKASDCNGQVYAFDATRDGKSYAIKLNAASGELTEVRKVR